MALFRSFSEIVNLMIERLKLVQPNLDTKPGTVSRDLFIDIQADQLEKVYRVISLVSSKQSLASAVGKDLDNLARNFSLARRSGSSSGGMVFFTTNSIISDISIPDGTMVTARNGATYKTVGSYTLTPSERSKFSSNANKYRGALNLAGINDNYAIEVPVQATRAGVSGNIAPLQIVSSNVQENLKVTNLSSFSGGSNTENDPSFRSRILAIFSGSNTGTSSGYRNAVLSVEGALDALVVEPGNTLMQRDGTETIEVNDGTSRIMSSGTGGKIDIYLLGRLLNEITESYVYVDKSGVNEAESDRNDYVLGLQGEDETLTTEERRVLALSSGSLPLQPVSSVVSVSGNKSGAFVEKFEDSSGITQGNYELIKDSNPDTGGSPFGFDKIHWISSEKSVSGESSIKSSDNEVSPVDFSDISRVDAIYQDIQIFSENSSTGSADRSIVKLNHYPITKVSRVSDTTTAEIYTLVSSGVDADTGINPTGEIEISGSTLPTPSDILSVEYTWRKYYDKYVDFNGRDSNSLFNDNSVVDAVDWGVSNGIFRESVEILKEDDADEFSFETSYDIDRVLSVYSSASEELTVENVDIGMITTKGVEIPLDSDAVSDIVSIVNSGGIELYNTNNNDGSFSSRVIYFPSDTAATVGDTVTVFYNKIEYFDIDNGDGSYYNNTVNLPSSSVLDASDALSPILELYEDEQSIYIKYVKKAGKILPSHNFANLPVFGVESGNSLLGPDLSTIVGSSQPVLFRFDDTGSRSGLWSFAPTNLNITVKDTFSSGKIRVTGTTMSRVEIDVTAGTSIDGLTFDIKSEIESAMNNEMSDLVGIARVDSAVLLDEDYNEESHYDILGYYINNSEWDPRSCYSDSTMESYEFRLPSTDNNSSIELTSGDVVRVSIIVYTKDNFEDLYFSKNESRITNMPFGSISRVSVSSGFRNTIGDILGSLSITPTNQPENGSSYFIDYKFSAPKEGERITIKYNMNSLLLNATLAMEGVRPITADVLIKEAEELSVNVSGTVLINNDSIADTSNIVENVSNAIVNMLNTSKLGSSVDYSDVVSAAASVSGVDSVSISVFNTDSTGRKAFINSLDNQTIVAGNIFFEAVEKHKFRII